MIGAGLVIFILWVFYFSRGSILMVIFAGLLALVASGAIDFFKKRFKMKNGLAITVTYLLIVLILISIPLLVLPAIISAVASLINVDWPTVVNNVVQRLDQIAAQLSMIPLVGSRLQESFTALADLLEQSSTSAQNVATPVVTLESMAGTYWPYTWRTGLQYLGRSFRGWFRSYSCCCLVCKLPLEAELSARDLWIFSRPRSRMKSTDCWMESSSSGGPS